MAADGAAMPRFRPQQWRAGPVVAGRWRMGRFLSTFQGRLDSKGRVSLPAAFRAVLEADGHPGVFLHPALEQPAIEAGGNRLLQEIDGLIGRFSPYSEARDLMATALLGQAEIAKLDPEGRLTLSERLKAHAGISGSLVFVGLGEKFRIWAPEKFVAHLEEATSNLRAVRAGLSPNG
jgi:MraZ protein